MKPRIVTWDEFSFVLDYDYNLDDETLTSMKDLWYGSNAKPGVILQAVQDFIQLKYSGDKKEQAHWVNARDFLFNDKYRFSFGGRYINLRELLSLLHMKFHIDRLREGILAKEKKDNYGKSFTSGSQILLV